MDEPRQHHDALSRRTELGGIPFMDLASQSHEDRMIAVGNQFRGQPADYRLAFLTDEEGKDGFEKADWYIRTLLALFPDLKCEKHRGPTPLTVSIIVTRRQPEAQK